jgi:hypothetical protein
MIIYPENYVSPPEVEPVDNLTPNKAQAIQWITDFVTEPKHLFEIVAHVKSKLFDLNVHVPTDKIKKLVLQVNEQWHSPEE